MRRQQRLEERARRAAEHQAELELHEASQAVTLAADLAEASERARCKLAQARQAAHWLSGQVEAKGAELERAHEQTRQTVAACEQLSLGAVTLGGGDVAEAETSLAEVTAMVAESIELGADAAVAAEREGQLVALQQEGEERGRRTMAEQRCAAYSHAAVDLEQAAEDLEAKADRTSWEVERTVRELDETTREAARLLEYGRAKAAEILSHAQQMVGGASTTPPDGRNVTRSAWLAVGAQQFEGDAYEIGLPHQQAAAWAEEAIAPALQDESRLTAAAISDAVDEAARAHHLESSVLALEVQEAEIEIWESAVTAVTADSRMDAVLRSPAAARVAAAAAARQPSSPPAFLQQPSSSPSLGDSSTRNHPHGGRYMTSEGRIDAVLQRASGQGYLVAAAAQVARRV